MKEEGQGKDGGSRIMDATGAEELLGQENKKETKLEKYKAVVRE